jgi:hypothetical protein
MKQTMIKKPSQSLAIPADVVIAIPPQVRQYMKQYRRLAALVPPICSRTRQEFGEQAELVLDLYQDPEIDDCYLQLRIRLPRYDRTTMERIYAITAEFDDQLCKATGWFQVTTDFRQPTSHWSRSTR